MGDFSHTAMGRNRNLPQTLTLDHVSPATRLLEKRRQMFEVQEALDAQKEEFARREEAFRRREEGLGEAQPQHTPLHLGAAQTPFET